MARRLVADGASSLRRVLTDPRNGAPLEIGRSTYRVPTALRQWLRLRDGRCPFPGCNNHSLDNDADHLLAWADGGTTGISNLGQPCRRHHRLKHTTPWTPVNATRDEPPGWISPTGRTYPSEHQDWEPPHWPEPPEHAREDQRGGDHACEDQPREDQPREDLDPEPPDWLAERWQDWPEWLDWPDDSTSQGSPGNAEPPLPVDPFPDWAHFQAA